MLGVHGVGGSNPPVPTIFLNRAGEISDGNRRPPRGRAKIAIKRITEMDHVKKQQSTRALPREAFKLTDLVRYQPRAIVSREILRKPAGTVSIFAFDESEELSEHTVPFDALVFGLEGEADIKISGRVHRLKSGEMMIMPGGKPHGLKARSPFKMALLMIRS
jgi:quercetin dioxygenase-like cupin family protein